MPEAPRPRAPGPPRIAEGILACLLPEGDRDPVLGDLAEEFTRRVAIESVSEARWWYRREVMRAAWPALRRRLGARRGTTRVEEGTMRKGTWAERLGMSWLDVKLGLRMLAKHPGLTLAAVLALAIGIPIGVAPVHLVGMLEAPLPEDAKDRIRVVRYWDVEANQPASPAYYDLRRWREQITAFESLGAFRRDPYGYDISLGDGNAARTYGAEVTASTFDILGTPPLMGRPLIPADERPGAPNVAVIDYGLWQSRLGGDPSVIGSILRVGGVAYTVVGVMPDGFQFPSHEHLWVPLREELATEPGSGIRLEVFGKLADGMTPDEAQVQVTALARQTAADFPESRGRLEAEVVPYGVAAWSLPRGGVSAFPGFFALRAMCLALLLVACGNVAMLVFARSATRFRELAIRTALGASRARIVSQMFVESLFLAVTATALGLPVYGWALQRLGRFITEGDQTEPEYWLSSSPTLELVGWALALAVLSTVLVGVLPALRVTGKRIQHRIQQARSRRSGIRFGGVTSALIVADVAVAVGAVGFGVGLWTRMRDSVGGEERVAIAAQEYLAATLTLRSTATDDADSTLAREGFALHLAETQRALVERLESEPGVLGVAVGNDLPRQRHDKERIELEGAGSSEEGGFLASLDRFVSVARVDVGFFDGLGVPVVAGRNFTQSDLDENARTVIVNTRFVDRFLGGGNAVGRRVRLAGGDEDAPWYEVVGVVPPLGMSLSMPEYDSGVYFPTAAGTIQPLRLAVHVTGAPEGFASRLRTIVGEIDPDVTLLPPRPLDEVMDGMWVMFLISTATLAGLVVILVGMAASGLYAIMSFAVSERTREIGIRSALGAPRGVAAFRVARRSVAQVAGGALIGMPLAASLFHATESLIGSGDPGAGVTVAVAVGTGLTVVATIASLSFVSPMRRALRISPTEALRAD